MKGDKNIAKINESILSKLSDEMKKKVEAAQTPEELLNLSKEAGYELTLEEMETIAGGGKLHCGKNKSGW